MSLLLEILQKSIANLVSGQMIVLTLLSFLGLLCWGNLAVGILYATFANQVNDPIAVAQIASKRVSV